MLFKNCGRIKFVNENIRKKNIGKNLLKKSLNAVAKIERVKLNKTLYKTDLLSGY